jgi:hypothetical protein
MGFISSISTEAKVTAAFYSLTVSVTEGRPGIEAWTSIKSVDGLMWFGSQGLGIVSDKLKTSVEGALSIDYDATIAALGDDSKFIVSGESFRIVHIENVGSQSEVLQILFKRELSN